MSLAIFALVLVAAALHAVWNALVKSGGDTLLTTVLVAAAGALIGLLVLPFLPSPAPASWPYLAVSGGLEIVYYALVASAYRHADMSRAYPLMRGLPPLIVALVSAIWLGVSLAPSGWVGIGLISAGILVMLWGSRSAGTRRGLEFALANALVIAAYTLTDGLGVRASGSPIAYTMWIFVLTGLPLAGWALLRRPQIVDYARRNWSQGLIGGVGTLTSYGLALFAMTMAPVPLVAALRETSIVFGTLIAVVVLRETATPTRLVAVLVIALGAVVLRLA